MLSISSDVAELRSELISLRREFHRFPEPGFEEHRTSRTVAEKLRECG